MKHYDYKDETKDVRGKVSAFGLGFCSLGEDGWLIAFILDGKVECYQ